MVWYRRLTTNLVPVLRLLKRANMILPLELTDRFYENQYEIISHLGLLLFWIGHVNHSPTMVLAHESLKPIIFMMVALGVLHALLQPPRLCPEPEATPATTSVVMGQALHLTAAT